MNNKIYFNKPYVSINDLKYVKQVFEKNKFADGDFQRACDDLQRQSY